MGESTIQDMVTTLQLWVENEGNIRIYPVCRNCIAKSIGLGQVRKIVGGEGYAIF